MEVDILYRRGLTQNGQGLLLQVLVEDKQDYGAEIEAILTRQKACLFYFVCKYDVSRQLDLFASFFAFLNWISFAKNQGFKMRFVLFVRTILIFRCLGEPHILYKQDTHLVE